MYLVLLSTDIVSTQDLELLMPEMNELFPRGTWSVDLGDEEKILRIRLSSNRMDAVRRLLSKRGFRSELLNIYHLQYGIDFPLVQGERGIPAANFVSFSLAISFFNNTEYCSQALERKKPAV
ncbi:MAG: hypothetical protein JNL13_03700 [Chitinophagaceae bacterium]|nr:hypothetical protein [Chitinophagaceae bacterium]